MKRRKAVEERRRRQERSKRLKRLMWSGIALAVVAGVAALVLLTAQPAQGRTVPIEGAGHVDVGALPARDSGQPPTSGDHYAEPAGPGFYEEPIDDGYLIHSLE